MIKGDGAFSPEPTATAKHVSDRNETSALRLFTKLGA
jgi:hypothetical protein